LFFPGWHGGGGGGGGGGCGCCCNVFCIINKNINTSNAIINV